MNAIPFTDLKIIIHELSKQEVFSTRKFLLAFDAEGHKLQNKNSILFDFMIQNPAATYAQTRQSGGKFESKKSFDQQCRRLKEKITESMILDVNIKRSETNVHQNMKLYIRKKLLIAGMLMERGAENEALSICHRLIKQAQEYELYAELHEILSWMRNETGLRSSHPSPEHINVDIEFYRYCEHALYRAKELYTAAGSVQDNNKSDYLKFITSARAELSQFFLNTRSVNIAYYYYLFEIKYNMLQRNFIFCNKFAFRLIKLVDQYPAVSGNIRMGSAYVELARSFEYLQNFDQSIQHAEKAVCLLPVNSYYYDLALETKFKSQFYKGRLEEAAMTLHQLIEITDKKKQPRIYWKRLYYLSCLNFSLKKYTESVRLMERIGKLKTGQESWNLGRKIITILCEIEMGKFDKSDRSIEALRKYLQRNSGNEQTLLHYKNVVKILVSLSNRSYLFKELKSLTLSYPDTETGDVAHNDSPEIQLFTQWLDSRMNNKVA